MEGALVDVVLEFLFWCTINAKNGVVSMIARDYEKPVDKDKDNVYKVTIIAIDSDKNTTSKDLGVTVKNVFEFVSKTITFDGLNYITLESPITGKIWLDRNLGLLINKLP
jgi:hypothetical protein